jgi:hypothetical protein
LAPPAHPALGGTLGFVPEFFAFLLAVGGFAVVLAAFAWLAARIRRRGTGGAFMGPIDEIYNPSAHRLRLEAEIHDQRMIPIPSTEDRP